MMPVHCGVCIWHLDVTYLPAKSNRFLLAFPNIDELDASARFDAMLRLQFRVIHLLRDEIAERNGHAIYIGRVRSDGMSRRKVGVDTYTAYRGSTRMSRTAQNRIWSSS